jgi:hypothetical protein
MSSTRKSLDEWLSKLEVKADRVLDIGGAQNPVKGRTKSWDVKNYLIADLPNPHEGDVKPDIELDLNTDFLGWPNYNLIFCLEVFEYVYDPVNAFRTIRNYLLDEGEAWVSFISIYPLHQPVEEDCLRYFPAGIKKMAEYVGLKVIQMIPRYTFTNAIYLAFRSEGMRCAKRENHDISGWIVRLKK